MSEENAYTDAEARGPLTTTAPYLVHKGTVSLLCPWLIPGEYPSTIIFLLFSYSSLQLPSATVKVLCYTHDVSQDSSSHSTTSNPSLSRFLTPFNLQAIKMLKSHAILIKERK